MIPTDPESARQWISALDALSKLGVVAFLVIGFYVVLSRRVITRGEKTDADVFWAERLADKDKDLAHERALVRALTRRLDRFQVVLERITGVKVPPDPED